MEKMDLEYCRKAFKVAPFIDAANESNDSAITAIDNLAKQVLYIGVKELATKVIEDSPFGKEYVLEFTDDFINGKLEISSDGTTNCQPWVRYFDENSEIEKNLVVSITLQEEHGRLFFTMANNDILSVHDLLIDSVSCMAVRIGEYVRYLSYMANKPFLPTK